MVEPNLDEFINQCKDKCYPTNGRNASNDLEGDFGTWEDWKLAIGEFVANQVREARIDEATIAWKMIGNSRNSTAPLEILNVQYDRIAELKGDDK